MGFQIIDTLNQNKLNTILLSNIAKINSVGEVGCPVWLGTWAYRLKLIIRPEFVDETLTDFPIMVKLSTDSGISDSDVSVVFDELMSDANRKKIAIVYSDCSQLYCEIEKWDDENELAWLHIKVPSISSSDNTYLYLYYDSAQPDNTTYIGDTTETPAINVWDSNFKGIYHLNQTPTPGPEILKDSVSIIQRHDLTVAGTPTLIDGKVGKGVDFKLNDYAYDFVHLIDYLPYTIETLSKTNGLGNFVGQYQNNSVNQYVYSYFDSSNHATGRLVYSEDYDEKTIGATAFPNNTWVYTAFVCETTISRKIYANGILDGINTNYIVNHSFGNVLSLARLYQKYTTNIPAIIDEVRISTTGRSAAWIKATYYSLWDSLITLIP